MWSFSLNYRVKAYKIFQACSVKIDVASLCRKLTFSIRGGGFEQAYFICVYTVVYNLKIGVHNQMGNHFATSFLDRELCTLNARFYPIREKLSQLKKICKALSIKKFLQSAIY